MEKINKKGVLMLLEELYRHYGTWTNLVRSLNIGSTTYQVWRKRGFIPFRTQLLIENKTKGRFKADELHAQPVQKYFESIY